MTRETRAQMEARHAAELAAWEAANEPWGPAAAAFWQGAYPGHEDMHPDTKAEVIRGLIAALPLAPIAAPVAMDEGAKRKLIEEIICAYNTNRVSQSPVADHILGKPYVQDAFEALARVPVAAWPGEGANNPNWNGIGPGNFAPAEPEWIEWHGGEFSDPEGISVEAETHCDKILFGPAEALDWERPNYIRRYRILPEQGGAA